MALTTVKQGGIATDAVGTAALDQDAGFTLAGLNGSSTVASEGGAVNTSIQQGLAKAWMNLNGTGTIATRDTLNTSSVTDNGTGMYTSNLSSSMNNANYSIGFTQGGANSVDVVKVYNSSVVQTTSLYKLLSLTSGFAPVDSNYLYTSVHGDLA